MLGFWLISGVAGATTWTVDPSDSSAHPDIASAITSAVSGDRIEVVPGIFQECLDTNGKDLDIEGISGSASTTISGMEDCESTLNIQSGETVQITGILLQHSAGRGLYVSGSHVTIQDAEISSSGSGSLDGGGIYISSGSLIGDGLVLTGNTADRGGNLLITDGAQVELIDSYVGSGQASRGGGVFVLDGSGGSGDLLLESCDFSGNQSDGDGAGLYLESIASLVSTDSSFTENQPTLGDGGAVYLGWASTFHSHNDLFTDNGSAKISGTWGGAIALGSYADVELEGVEFSGNMAGYGGAISASYDNSLVLTECTFLDQEAENGGALALEDGAHLVDTGSIYSGNRVTTAGGAIWASDGVSLEMSGLSLSQNQSEEGDGGALWLEELRSLEMDATDFEDNFASNEGGAVWAEGSDSALSLVDLVFTTNQADQGSGGALVLQDLSLQASQLSFLGNKAGAEGGAIWAYGVEEIQLVESVFESNAAGSGSSGGALWLSFVSTLEVTDSRFCDNSAETGGAVYGFYMHGTDAWTGNIFQENQATADGGALYLVYSASQAMQNNTLVGNQANGSGGSIWATGIRTDFVNNIVAHTLDGDGLYLDDESSDADSTWRYSNWYDNQVQDASGSSTLDVYADGNLAVDPGFVDYSQDGDCNNDVFTLSSSSDLVDAGDPSILDLDGSPSDIGAESVRAPEEKKPEDTGGFDTGSPDSGSPEDTAVPPKDTSDPDTAGPDTSDSGAGPQDSGPRDTGASEGSDTDASGHGQAPGGSDPDCGCASGSQGLGWSGLLLLGLYGRRRRSSAGSVSNPAHPSAPPVTLQPPG